MQAVGAQRPVSLHVGLALFGVLLIVVCALASGLAVHVVATAASYMTRAGKSYEQLVLVNRLEADINAWMLNKAVGWANSNDVERTLALYMASIRDEQEELHDVAEREAQTGEFAAATELRDDFRALKADLDDLAGRAIDQANGQYATRLQTPEIVDRLAKVRSRVSSIVSKEQSEVADTTEALLRLRWDFSAGTWLVVVLTAASLLAILLFFYSVLVAPITRLVQGAGRLGGGDLEARVLPGGPRETVELANRFNEMAAQISEQHHMLLSNAERLEALVQERTLDLKAKTEQLSDIDRSRRLFFAKIGHELRTPVTVLKGEADVALRNAHLGEAGLRDALGHISASADALNRRLADLLALARSEDGRVALQRKPLDLAECAKSAVEAASAFASSNGTRLVVEGCEQPVRLTGDANWIAQALFALIDNAVKFSPHGGDVTVTVARSDASISISVADQGLGAPDDMLGHLFDPYFQAENAVGRGGSGLGLAVARWVCKQHGGSISARNGANGGFVVMMTISEQGA